MFSDFEGEINKLFDWSVLEKSEIFDKFCHEIDVYLKCNILREIHIHTDPLQGKMLRVIKRRISEMVSDGTTIA